VPRLGRPNGKALRVLPFGAERGYTQSLAPLAERKHDLVLSMPWIERTRWHFSLPEGMHARSLPAPVSLTTPYGHLTMSFKTEGRSVIAESELAVTVPTVKAGDYPAFRAFLAQVDEAFSKRFELVAGASAKGTSAKSL